MAKLYWRLKVNGKWQWRRQHLPHPVNPEIFDLCECTTCRLVAEQVFKPEVYTDE